MTDKPKAIVNLRLRMPEALRRKLVAEAKASHRSLNSEIVYRLGQSLGPEGEAMVQAHATAFQTNYQYLKDFVCKLMDERESLNGR